MMRRATYLIGRLARDFLLRFSVFRRLNRSRASARTGPTTEPTYVSGILAGHLRRLREHGIALGGATVLELGPGQTLAQALLCRLLGAARAVAVDVEPFATLQHPVYGRIVRNVDAWVESGELLVDESAATRPSLVDQSGQLVPDDSLRYCITSHGLLPLPDDSVDIVYSTSVLEHVDDVPRMYREMFRVTRPGAMGSHIVDLKDHIRAEPLDMLRYSDRLWHLMQGHSPGFINRLRISDHLDAVSGAGLEVVDIDERHLEEPINREVLVARFRAYPDEVLRVGAFIMVVRKPA